jgi:uncharacterized OB-fold protein
VKKICPKCGRRYYEKHNYCSKCAEKLIKDNNRCSDPKSTYCEHAVFEDDDVVCSYCGAMTVYEAERKEMCER